jgi:hypothetical protein
MMRTGWDLFRTGRISLKSEGIERREELSRLMHENGKSGKRGVA